MFRYKLVPVGYVDKLALTSDYKNACYFLSGRLGSGTVSEFSIRSPGTASAGPWAQAGGLWAGIQESAYLVVLMGGALLGVSFLSHGLLVPESTVYASPNTAVTFLLCLKNACALSPCLSR